MKKQKIFLIPGIFLAVVFLAGCGAQDDVRKMQTPPVPPAGQKASDAAKPAAALPETVSAKPGATVDAEIGNIDEDLKAIDDSSLNGGLSDAELGL